MSKSHRSDLSIRKSKMLLRSVTLKRKMNSNETKSSTASRNLTKSQSKVTNEFYRAPKID
jgi:hypothetical protein